MAQFWLPGDSDFALAMREPNLLVPGKKPVSSLPIKRGALTRGLKLAWVFVDGRGLLDSVSGLSLPLPSGVTQVGDRLHFDGSSTAYFDADLSINSACAASDEITQLVIAQPEDYASYDRRLFGMYNGNKHGFIWLDTAGAGDSWAASAGNATSSLGENEPFALDASRPQMVVVTANLSEQKLYVDGSLVDSDTGTTRDMLDTETVPHRLGGIAGLTQNFKGHVSAALIWDRVLSAYEIAVLNANFYGELFELSNQSPFLISVPAGGGAPTLSSPGVINVLSDRATPQVTLTF